MWLLDHRNDWRNDRYHIPSKFLGELMTTQTVSRDSKDFDFSKRIQLSNPPLPLSTPPISDMLNRGNKKELPLGGEQRGQRMLDEGFSPRELDQNMIKARRRRNGEVPQLNFPFV